MRRTSHDAKPGQRYRRDDRALATTDGAVAAPGIHDAVRQVELQFHGATVARGAVPGLDDDATNFLEHSRPPSRHGVSLGQAGPRNKDRKSTRLNSSH